MTEIKTLFDKCQQSGWIPEHKKSSQIKIKNDLLVNSGFEIGKEFAVVYQPGKITLVVIAKSENNI